MNWIRVISPQITARLLAAALLVAVAAGAAQPTYAQGSRKDDIVFNAQGRPMAGATVRVCISSATGQPCSPLANIYSDAALTQALANPTTTDGLGNYSFYAAPGRYEIEISGPSITTKQIPNVILPNDPSAPTFTSVTSTSGISAFSLSLSGNLTVTGSAAVTGSLTVAGNPVPTTNQANNWTQPQTFSNGLTAQGPSPFWRDVAAYGAQNHLGQSIYTSTYGTITSGSHTVTITNGPAGTVGLQVGSGVFVGGAGPTATVSTPTISAVSCFGPVQTLVTSSSSSCGSQSWSYAVAAVDALGGTSAASATVTFSNGISTLTPDNYNWGYGALPTGAKGVYVWQKKGAGAWACLGLATIPNESTSSNFYFEDWGQTTGQCPPWIPSSPPGAATADPLISTITAVNPGVSITMSAAASNNPPSAYCGTNCGVVYPDDSAAFAAAILAANNDTTTSTTNSVGAPCVLAPGGSQFFISHLDIHDILGGNPAQPICIRLDGNVILDNLPIFLDAGNVDLGGAGASGGTGTPNSSIITLGPFDAITVNTLQGGTNVHDLFLHLDGNGIETAAPNVHIFNDGYSVGQDYAALRVGANSIFVEIDHLFINAGPSANQPASIVFDCVNGGTTNSVHMHDNIFHNHTIKFQGEDLLQGSLGKCAFNQFEEDNDTAEVSLDHGWWVLDEGFPGVSGTNIGPNVRIIRNTNADPATSYPSLLYVNQPSSASEPSGLEIEGNNIVGPWYSDAYTINSLPDPGGPCNAMQYWHIVGGTGTGNDGLGSSQGCDGSHYTSVGAGSAGGFQTDGGFFGLQPVDNVNALTSFAQLAMRPFWTSLSTSASGGTLAAATYYYQLAGCMTSSNTTGCTDLSYEDNVTTAGTTSSNTIGFNLKYQSRFDHFQIWRGTSAGGENAYQTTTCSTPPSSACSFTDTGAAGTSATPQSYNTALYTSLSTKDSTPSYVNSATNGDPNHALLVGPLPSAARSGAKLDVSGGTLSAEAGFTTCLATKSANYTLTAADCWVNVTGTTTITVPHAVVGQRWVVFNSGSGTVTVAADSGNVNGGANITLAADTGREVTCDGTNCFAH